MNEPGNFRLRIRARALPTNAASDERDGERDIARDSGLRVRAAVAGAHAPMEEGRRFLVSPPATRPSQSSAARYPDEISLLTDGAVIARFGGEPLLRYRNLPHFIEQHALDELDLEETGS